MGLPEAVIGGAVISRIYRIALGRALYDGSVTPVLTDWDCPKDPVYVVFASARAITPKARAVVALIRELLAEAERPERVKGGLVRQPTRARALAAT